jgi:cysteine-rich repeat protein
MPVSKGGLEARHALADGAGMATRPALSVLVFALAGCIGDNDVMIHGGGDGGGSDGAEPMDGDASSGDDGDDTDGDPGGPDTHGGGGGETSDGAGESGEDQDPCGDAVLASFEQCDDGNEIDGDGCESNCRITIGVERFGLGGAHTCAVDYFGDVRCWGDNAHGQLGYASLGVQNVGANITPIAFNRDVSIGAPVNRIELGMDHTCAVTNVGEVYCWGRNDAGQLGYGHTDDLGDEPGEAPSDVGPVPLGAAALSIAAGRDHTCALLVNGELRCWGGGARGQLGIGDGFAGSVGAGIKPYARAADGPAIDMLGVGTRAVHIGVGEFGCVIDRERRVYCWGANESGQAGIGRDFDIGVDEPAMKVPAQVEDLVLRIAVGDAHVCVATETFAVQCFGRNASGQLGNASTDDIGDDEPPQDGRVHLDGHDAQQLAAGADFTCVLLDDASVRCWGSGAFGQLGNAHTETVGDDEYPADWPGFGSVPLLAPATAIAAGAHHVCARTGDAELRCWGSGADGRLGYGDEDNVGDGPGALPMLPVPIF